MQNQWEKNTRNNKIKALTIAVLAHAIFFVALFAYSNSSADEGVIDWVKNKMSKENTEEMATVDQPRS
jgi:hypothetical protein